MFSSMAEALGINSTFFVQFVIFLLFYPVLSRWFFRPYFQQEQKREQETTKRVQQAEQLKEKQQALEKEYKARAYQLNKDFNTLYNKEIQKLKSAFLNKENQKTEEIKQEYQQKQKSLSQEIKQAQQDMKAEIPALSSAVHQRLLSNFLIPVACLVLKRLLVPSVAFAGSGEGIPFGFLFSQVFNFSLFVLILFFILRKNLPAFLRQKKADFLEYRQKAKALEQKYQADNLIWQKKLQSLMNKQENIKADVAEAVRQKEKEMAQETENRLKVLRARAEQALRRARLKETSQLKTWLVSQVMTQAREQIKAEEPAKKSALNSHIVQKWEAV